MAENIYGSDRDRIGSAMSLPGGSRPDRSGSAADRRSQPAAVRIAPVPWRGDGVVSELHTD